MLNSKANLNRNQYGALISWAFNMGCGNADSSTLVGRLNNGEDPNIVISQELPQWVMPVARDFRVWFVGAMQRLSWRRSQLVVEPCQRGVEEGLAL